MCSSRRGFYAALVMTFALAMMGCEGDDGNPGPPGPQGPEGPQGPPPPTGGAVDIGDADQIDPGITGVTIASPAVVSFSLADGDGAPITGLSAGSVSFTISNLVPGNNGDSSQWQSYVTRVEPLDGMVPDVLMSAVQATTENSSNGTLVDNGDGTYVYTFATDLDNAATPFDPTLTHRVGLEIRGFVPTEDNGSYTFRPSDGATTGLFTREIVDNANCNACHNKLALHGNARFDTDYCVTCHNPGSTDQDSANTVDFKVMVHKIHRGKFLPSVEAGGQYAIWGFNESEHDYSEVVFPQDIRNCRNCHNENDPDTPDAINWLTVPTMEACGSCHDDVNFMTGENHSDANLVVTSNADCTICHSTSGFVGPIDQSHAILEQQAAESFQFNVIGITDTAPGETPTVTLSVTDPTNNDAPYDILNDAPFVQGGGASRVAVDLGWSTSDYTNTGSGSEVPGFRPGSAAQMVSLNPLTSAVDNMDGTFSVTSGVAIPAFATGSGLVAIEGHPAEDLDGDMINERIPVTGATDFFAITDATPQARRQVVDLNSCLNCHQQLSLHGSNRTDNINLCVGCHNANATDIRARTEFVNNNPMTPFADGKSEEAIDFKRMVHRIHAADIVVYGFGGSEHDYRDVEFPGILSDCTACHDGDTYYPVGTSVLATTIDTGPDLGDPLDDINITPNAAVCSSCHTSTLDIAHMVQNGGAFDAMQLIDGSLVSISAGPVIETCDVCHGEGSIADVAVMHDLD